MRKKIMFLIISLFMFIPSIKAIEIKSKNAILYNMNNDEVIFEKNSEEVIKIASLTKIMTAIVAIENINDLNEKVIITDDMLKGLKEANASVIGFKVGDIITYLDLLYATLLPSAADAAQALAFSISGNDNSYVDLMNAKAKELGLKNTLYTNTTGLDYLDNHSTVSDVAKLLKYALSNDTFKKIYETKTYTMTNGVSMIRSLDKSILRYNLDIDYIKGAKTGYTGLAGLCLSSTTSNQKTDYLLVVCGADPSLNLPYNIIDSDTIYDYYFSHYKSYNIINKKDVVASINNKYSKNKIKLLANTEYSLYMLDSDYEKLKFEYDGLDEIDVFTSDKIIGKYKIILDDKIIKEIDIYKPDKVELSIIQFVLKNIYIFVLSILVLFGIVLLIIKGGKHASKNYKSR